MRYQADARGLTLTTDWPETPVRVRADEAALQRICDNLLSNAVKFTSEGGIHVSVTPQGETVALVIEDTGIGMEEAFQEEMFEAFTQASTGNARTHEGSGLGLTITKELVERMDGDIAIQSAPGEGTTVTVTLPAAA
jgi:signal transduction histidine kinase